MDELIEFFYNQGMDIIVHPLIFHTFPSPSMLKKTLAGVASAIALASVSPAFGQSFNLFEEFEQSQIEKAQRLYRIAYSFSIDNKHKLPKNSLEVFAQLARFYYSICTDPKVSLDSKDLVCHNLKNAVDISFDEAEVVACRVRCTTDEVDKIAAARELLLMRKSHTGSIKIKHVEFTMLDYLRMFDSLKSAQDLLTPEYVVKKYHPYSAADSYFNDMFSNNFFVKFPLALQHGRDKAKFDADPMARAQKREFMDFTEYLKSKEYDLSKTIHSAAIQEFIDRFGQNGIDSVKRAVWNYASGKTDDLVLPKEIESYLNS